MFNDLIGTSGFAHLDWIGNLTIVLVLLVLLFDFINSFFRR